MPVEAPAASVIHPLPSVSLPDAGNQIIELLRPIVAHRALTSYADIWQAYGFTITPHYNAISWETNPFRFTDESLADKVDRFQFSSDRSYLENAQRAAVLVRRLIDAQTDGSYFDHWAAAGFHVTPLPPPPADSGFLPNVFLLGAAKCGTTTLHAYMEAMPEVCMAAPKEPFFFEAEYELGLRHYQRLYFSHWKGEPLIGDARQRNLYFHHLPARIYETNPNAKLLAILRNPIDRAYSHWWHRYSVGNEHSSFETAIREDYARIQSGHFGTTPHEAAVYRAALDLSGKGIYRTYLDGGYYAEQLARYLEYFPREQMKILFYEDLAENPYQMIREIEDFIGTRYYTPDNFVPIRVNTAKPEQGGRVRTPISPELRAWLQDHFRDHNHQLTQLTGRDVSHWQ